MNRCGILQEESGSTLITFIVMTLVLSTVGLFILSTNNAANMGDVTSYLNARATLLAESGYQFLTSQYKQSPPAGKNDSLQSLHNQTYTLLDGGGVFTLSIQPYYYATAAAHTSGASSLSVRFPGAKPTEFIIPKPGTLAIWGTDMRYHCYDYKSISQSADLYTFEQIPKPGLLESIPQGTSVVQVCNPAWNQTVTNGSDNKLVLDKTTSQVFPLRFGAFDLDAKENSGTNNVYLYQTRNGDTLQGISVYGDPNRTFSFTVDKASNIYAHPLASLSSTGTFASGDSATSSTFSRIAVLGVGPGGSGGLGGAPPFTENGDVKKSLKENWNVLAGHVDIESRKQEDKQPAITIHGKEVLLGLDLPQIGFQFSPTALVSYDIQTKVKVDFDEGKDGYYITGISFRLNGDASHSYGISFFKAYPGVSVIPPALDAMLEAAAIKNGIPHVILWVKDESDLASPYRLLEYKALQLSDGCVETTTYLVKKQPVTELSLKAWSTLVVAVDEEISEATGARENHISAYLAGPTSFSTYPGYPLDLVVWPDNLSDRFLPVSWHASTQPIIDATITHAEQSTTDPEVGLHGFYENNDKEQMFDDFSFRVRSGVLGTGGGAPGM